MYQLIIVRTIMAISKAPSPCKSSTENHEQALNNSRIYCSML